MSLKAGQMLQHYRVVEKIGEGGMGAVWRATDTELDRDVAIKALPPGFAADPDRQHLAPLFELLQLAGVTDIGRRFAHLHGPLDGHYSCPWCLQRLQQDANVRPQIRAQARQLTKPKGFRR